MARKPVKRPSFFKIICRKDFTRLLRLPPLFMQRYGSNLPKKVKLRMESGRTWNVKVGPMEEEEEDGLFCFSKGWNVFSKDVGLKFGQFLVFNLNDINGLSGFEVCVYEPTGCQKEEDIVVKTESSIREAKAKESNPLYYEFVLKRHQTSRVTPIRAFARAADLMEKRRVMVVGEHHKQWVALDHNLKDTLRIDMAQGWTEFRIANHLVFGKTYSFEFKPNKNVIKVKEVKY